MKEISPALKQFCEKEELMRLAYADDKDYPRVVPVWFVVIDDDYCIGTYTSAPKCKAFQRDPRAGWVVDGGEKPKYKGVSMYGRVEEVTDLQERALIYEKLGEKYFGSSDDPAFVEIYGKVDDGQTAYFKLKVEGGTSWEY